MTSLIGRMFSRAPATAAMAVEPTPYQLAVAATDDLLEKMRAYSNGSDAARAIMADVWAQNHNVPFLTTMHEAAQEAAAGIKQRSEDK